MIKPRPAWAILKFPLPEQEQEHRDALNGAKWRCIVAQMDEWLRQQIKYGNLPKRKHDTMEEVRAALWHFQSEDGLDCHEP